jgi:hypothetical protein
LWALLGSSGCVFSSTRSLVVRGFDRAASSLPRALPASSIRYHVICRSNADDEREAGQLPNRLGDRGLIVIGGLLYFFGPVSLRTDEVIVIGLIILALIGFQIGLRRSH